MKQSKGSKITLRISDEMDAYLQTTAETFSALLGHEVSKSEILIRLAEEGKFKIDAMKCLPEMFSSNNSISWTNLSEDE